MCVRECIFKREAEIELSDALNNNLFLLLLLALLFCQVLWIPRILAQSLWFVWEHILRALNFFFFFRQGEEKIRNKNSDSIFRSLFLFIFVYLFSLRV